MIAQIVCLALFLQAIAFSSATNTGTTGPAVQSQGLFGYPFGIGGYYPYPILGYGPGGYGGYGGYGAYGGYGLGYGYGNVGGLGLGYGFI